MTSAALSPRCSTSHAPTRLRQVIVFIAVLPRCGWCSVDDRGGRSVTGSVPRQATLAGHHPGEHLRRGAEGDGAHETAADGEVEDDLGLAEVEPGATRPAAEEDRERGPGAAVE